MKEWDIDECTSQKLHSPKLKKKLCNSLCLELPNFKPFNLPYLLLTKKRLIMSFLFCPPLSFCFFQSWLPVPQNFQISMLLEFRIILPPSFKSQRFCNNICLSIFRIFSVGCVILHDRPRFPFNDMEISMIDICIPDLLIINIL